MEIQRGSTRVVLLFEGFVLKFPRMNALMAMMRDAPLLAVQGRWSTLRKLSAYKWSWFMKGIRQNVTERKCWKACRASFLVPTYLSLGFMNIQKRERGDKPSLDEMDALVRRMGEVTENQTYTVDPHCFSPGNFLKSGSGYRVFDYGNGSYQPLRFTDYILRWQDELSKVLRIV